MRQMNFKEIFDTISEKEGHIFKVDEMYSPKTKFKIKDENGEFQEISGMIIKEYEVLKITTETGKVVEVAKAHGILTERGMTDTSEIKVEDVLVNRNGNEKIVEIEELPKQVVYDIAINTDNHLYSDAYGFVHHNTFHVSKALKEMYGDPKGPDAKWKHFKGLKGTALGLYRILYQYRKNMTIVFDDSDGFLNDRDCINMLKSAMDTDTMREISWFSNATLNVDGLEPEKAKEYLANLDLAFQDPDKIGLIGSKKYRLPSSFEFDSQIIFVSNLPGDKFLKDPDLAAIKSRSVFMDVFLRREDVVERIKSLLQFIVPEMELEDKEELLEAMKEGEGKLTMRSIVAACGIASSGVVDGGIEEIKRLTSAYIS